MKKIMTVVVLVTFTLVSFTGFQKNKKVVTSDKVSIALISDGIVNLKSSVIKWKGFKPTGSHNGTVLLKEGTMKVKRGKLKGGTFVVDMTTIKDTDRNKRLEKHLNSADFFDVKKYQTATFVITKVKGKKENMMVTGNMTIKDVTKSITISASIFEIEGVVTFKSETFKINRADFNVKYKSKSFFANLKDKFINDMIEMSFEVKSTK